MAQLKKQWQVFVNEMIKHGDHTVAYQKAYPNATKNAARVSSYNLLQKPTIAEAINKHARKAAALAEKKAVEERSEEIKGVILTAAKKREILAAIASGEQEIEKIVFTKNGPKKVMCKPDHVDIMKAIDLDNKMAGDYAPDKLETTHKGSIDISKWIEDNAVPGS